ncbi:hypothetical protein H2199_007705 [Coniosporium tulheliwenetii]|uniref:Uncharacterized protein n=1 Tax=Coniosporium tulheliwenetii TaxID=3383036 RepID=A0ACC2YNP5_9PEZI|nr:hypothetical protein H2199_007705 [Cladosporium sp. JES 115]
MGALSDGLPRFAALISFDEDKSTTIYRRFDRVAARDLLRMESELAWLEAEQDFLDTNIPKELKEELGAALISTQEHRFHANYEWEQDFDVFCTSAEKKWQEVSTTDTFASPGETWKESLEAVYELSLSQKDYKAEASELGRDIGIQLRDIVLDASARALRSSLYSPAWIERLRSVITESEIRFEPLRPDDLVDNIKDAALKSQSDVLALPRPQRRPLKQMRRLFKNLGQTPMIVGYMEDHLEDGSDLSVLAPPMERDRLTALLEGRFSWVLTLFKSSSDEDVDYVSHETVTTIVATFSIIVAALFLIGAILVLYLVTNPGWRLFILCMFTVGFAACLGALTNARRQDIFAAVAAYAAVLVVFVSGDLANENTNGMAVANGAGGSTGSITTVFVQTPSATPSPPATSTAATASNSSSSGLSIPALVGIGVGSFLITTTFALSIYCCVRTSKRRVGRRVIVRRKLDDVRKMSTPDQPVGFTMSGEQSAEQVHQRRR